MSDEIVTLMPSDEPFRLVDERDERLAEAEKKIAQLEKALDLLWDREKPENPLGPDAPHWRDL